MRVVHVTDGYLPRVGGIELHVRDLVVRQRAAGTEACVLTATRPHGVTSADPAWVTRAGAREARAGLAARPPAVVHAHLSVASPFALQVAREALRRGVPLVLTVHSMWTGWGPVPRLALAALGDPRAAVWSAVSTAAAGAVTEVLGGDVAVQVAGNAVDVDRWRPAPGSRLDPVRPVTVVSVMRLTRTKRTRALAEILVDVRRRLPADVPLRAVVVGEGPEAGVLRRRLDRAGADTWVHLAGRLDRAGVREHLRSADVFLAPADREAFGIAALEARTAGLAVVAHRRSGIADFVEHRREGLLADDDHGLAEAVAGLVTDRRLLTAIRDHNVAHVPACTWGRVLGDLDTLYARAADRAPAPTFARGGPVSMAVA